MRAEQAVLVTGAARRIGRAIALYLADQGYDIAAHYHRSRDDALALRAEIEAKGRACHLIKADLAETAGLSALIADAFAAMPHCRHLVNNASVFDRVPFLEGDEALFDREFAVNLKAPVFLTQAFARAIHSLPLQGGGLGWGALSRVRTLAGKRPPPDLPLAGGGMSASVVNLADSKVDRHSHPYFFYLMSKKSLRDFTLMAAAELGPRLRVNAVLPGFIVPAPETPADYQEKLARRLPLKRTATPQDIAQAVHMLIATPSLTGQLVRVDGGEGLV
jgi:NAD(P)-dependent dehydrogenase (short-subunit alcohol dehydrogenase family)